LRLVEHFEWDARPGRGTNVLEEIGEPGASRAAGRSWVDVFFYGLFMDPDVLRAKGLAPVEAERASVRGWALRIGQRAALAPEAGARAHGVVMSLARSDLERLYSEPSVRAYEPQAVVAELASGGTVAALCYNLPQPPPADERDPDYAAKLRAVGQKVGLPTDYVASI
jgi:hypothetical protein